MTSTDTDIPRVRRLDPDQHEALLEAAANEFAAHGFDGASVKAIADAAGMTKPRIFYYFDGKEDLYSEVMSRLLGELLAPAGDLPPPEDAEAYWSGLAEALERMARQAETNARGIALAQSLYRRGGDAPSYVRLLSRVSGLVTAWLERGRRLGAVRTDLPVELLCNLTIGALVQVDRAFVESATWSRDARSGAAHAEMDGLIDGLVRIARDALRQSVPATLDVEMNYAGDTTPTTVDAYVQVGDVETVPVVLRDGRQSEPAPTLQTHAFQLIEAPVRFEADLTDDRARQAYPAIEQRLTELTGARKAMVFDHTVRRTAASPDGRQPIHLVHADYAKGAGERRLRELLPEDEAQSWIANGFLIVNLWQSIDGVVHSSPLAFADRRTVSDGDFLPVTVEYGERTGQIGYYRHNPAHDWYWYSFLRSDEALLFKTYEPAAPGRHWSCPHSAFSAPIEPPEAGGARSSVEFRIALALGGEA